MVEVKVIKQFMDKKTSVIRNREDVLTVEDARAEELLKAGVVEKVRKVSAKELEKNENSELQSNAKDE